jgi:hypothetical protein
MFGEGSEALQLDRERNVLWLLTKVRAARTQPHPHQR